MIHTDINTQTASLTLIRTDRGRPEIFWARRRADRAFLGGFFSFFAGSVEPTDAALPTTGAPPNERAPADLHLRTAALRECFEECGALFCATGLLAPGTLARDPAHQLSEHLPAPLDTARLHCAGTWRTPSWMPPTCTTFFTLTLTHAEARTLDTLAEHLDPDELEWGQWITPEQALHAWHHGLALLTTPLTALLAQLASQPGHPTLGPTGHPAPTAEAIEYLGGIVALPLRTATLPPATHTNTYLIGRERFLIVDPGPDDADELARLIALIDARRARGHTPTAILLTHHHPDHVGGARALAERFHLQILAHPRTAEILPALGATHLTHGQRLELGAFGELEAWHTPGHAPGHLALVHAPTRSVFAGDLVASRGTIIVNPPRGHMGDYLRSLHTLLTFNPDIIWPAHGLPIVATRALLTGYIDHRFEREAKVLDALRAHPRATAAELVPGVYPELPPQIWPLAERSLLAHLIHLVEQGLARALDGDRYQAR
ncbi:hypothetical protein DL240_18680 [Lujinxingia litoralis]|uniref:Nudix hydrolase domain-containing protein n=1 Tax=Lujinxingia litoralis TaxID=2211119 RepID=A0A328C0N1_9DELT|nr:MBL fold metallo-hydrolase [Lujinxingia litoralis]RAL20136.1 hypothetical protein DL240_18680 [Lujinxingia litoralis]